MIRVSKVKVTWCYVESCWTLRGENSASFQPLAASTCLPGGRKEVELKLGSSSVEGVLILSSKFM